MRVETRRNIFNDDFHAATADDWASPPQNDKRGAKARAAYAVYDYFDEQMRLYATRTPALRCAAVRAGILLTAGYGYMPARMARQSRHDYSAAPLS